MNASKNKSIILSLIKEDLIYSHLISGLAKLGINAQLYSPGISDIIFELMNIPKNQKGEELFAIYLNLRNNKISALNINALQASVDILAEEIYEGVWGEVGCGVLKEIFL